MGAGGAGDTGSVAAVLPTGAVSFLVTDIEGSTQLYQRLGTRFEELLEQHREICRRAFAAHRGAEVACPGDGFIVAFATAADALSAAVDAQRELVAHPWPEGDEVRVRMGVHSGDVRLTASGGTYFGIAVHEAARIGDAGAGGQIVVSAASVELLEGHHTAGVELVSLGIHRLRGLDGGHHLYEVHGSGLPDGFPSLRTQAAASSNMPPDPFELFGRTSEVPEVAEAVSQHRLTTLVGPGGVGKTRLATVAAGHLVGRFADGCWFVDLSGLPEGATADDVASVIGAAVSVEASLGVAGLAATISARSLLLVVDNCEHVLAAAAAAVSKLLAAGPQIRVLATSRAPLSMRDEQLIQVAPLALADSSALFARRAFEVAPSVHLGTRDPDVVRICEQLDGLPLAIELAAHRIRVLSAKDIAHRLDDRFALLKGGAHDADPRQRTLEATIDWSYDLLEEPERTLLRRLSVFRGGAEPSSVEEVCSGGALERSAVIDVMTSLVERSLVKVDRAGDTVRYGMLRSIDAYARRQLEQSGELEGLRARHLHHLADRSWDTLWAMLRGTVTDELQRLAYEADNLRAAISWAYDGGDLDQGLRLACGAGFFGRECVGGYVYASRRWIEELLERGAAADDPDLRCQALVASANVSVAEGDWMKVLQAAEGALALVEAEGLGDVLRSQALGMVGVAAEQAHPMREVAAIHASLLDQTGPDASIVPSRDPADAIGLQRESAELALQEGLLGYRVLALTNLTTAALQIGESSVARQAGETALFEARRLGLGGVTARALDRLAYVALREGDVPGAVGFAGEALAAAVGSGATGELGATHTVLATLSVLQGDEEGARQHAFEAKELFASLGHWVPVARMWASGASVYYAIGMVSLAREAVEQLVESLALIGDHPAIPVLLVNLVTQTEAAGHADLAAALRTFLPPTQ